MKSAQLAEYCLDVYDSPGLHGHVVEVDDLRAEVIGDGPQITIAFRGTTSLRSWIRDLDARKTAHPWGKVHAGFWGAWETLKPALAPFVAEARSVVWTGHSLGGAIATCGAADYAKTALQLVTFGGPRVGTGPFADTLDKTVPQTRFVHRFDPVTRLPSALWGFRHSCPADWYDGSSWGPMGLVNWLTAAWSARASIVDEVLHDHDISNYVAALQGPRAMLAKPSRGPDWPHLTVGLKRSNEWPRVRREHLKLHPVCEISGTDQDLDVHHIEPFHVDPSKELDPNNLMTLTRPLHLYMAHLGRWDIFNPHIREDARIWREKIAKARS